MRDVVDQPTKQPAAHASLPGEPASNAPRDLVREELAAALAARDRFLGLIGHELRNAVAPMLLLAEQFSAMAEDPAASAMLASRTAMLNRCLGRFVSTINRVTEVSDLRRGKLRFELTATDLGDVVAEVCREADREAAAGGAELVIDAAAPVVGSWDRGRVKQIVANLVSNAIRYGGGGRVELTVCDRGTAGELIVRDHGPGLDPEALVRLFAPFDSIGSAGHERTGRTGGFGIGLWVVKMLCTAMQGSVTAENDPGGGGRFCVVLPRG